MPTQSERGGQLKEKVSDLCSRAAWHNLYYSIKSYVSNFYVGMAVEKNVRRHIAIQNVAKIISVVEALYAILTVCLG